jgi:DnaJ-class molecular chaperone
MCNDTGVIEIREAMKCAACDGTGQILGSPCICCGGSGEQQILVRAICPKCDNNS